MFPKDAITIYGTTALPTVDPSFTQTLLSTSTPYTILHAELLTASVSTGTIDNLECGSTKFLTVLSTNTTHIADRRGDFDGVLNCSSNLTIRTNIMTSHNVYYSITYVPYRLASTTTQSVTYADWLLVALTLIFCISFVTWGYFFSIFKPK